MAGLGDYSKKGKGNRGYKMKGPSLLKMVEKEKKHFLERDKTGPIAEVKKVEKVEVEPGADVTLDPGYEDPIKVQKSQEKGVTPGSQTFTKPKTSEEIKSFTAAQLETKGSAKRKTIRINK